MDQCPEGGNDEVDECCVVGLREKIRYSLVLVEDKFWDVIEG